ncbi:hypothetical protein LCGC14_1753510 [marine sediment metagenome]|uniref:Uncharacterized protein n=1 Tax=marine sediment metagenome TaxID=412755 RepID=A0A0F9JIA7_9ZZZZ
MGKYKNIRELANAFKSGELSGWVLMVDNDKTHLRWIGPKPDGIEADTDAGDEFEYKKSDEGYLLWNSPDVYILDQALAAAGIPNEGV